MKTCKYCYWQFDIRLESNQTRRGANDRGFCGPACVIAWDAEKEYALKRAREEAAKDGWDDTGAAKKC